MSQVNKKTNYTWNSKAFDRDTLKKKKKKVQYIVLENK